MKSSSGRARAQRTLRAMAPRVNLRTTLCAAFCAAFGTTVCGLALRSHRARPPSRESRHRVARCPGARCHARCGASRQKTGRRARAARRATSRSNPRDAQAKFKRATVLARLNRDDEAIAAFTELTEAYPELPEPYNNLATLYAKRAARDEARAALETGRRQARLRSRVRESRRPVPAHGRVRRTSARRARLAQRHDAQRLADIEKIVTPPKVQKPAVAAQAVTAADARRIEHHQSGSSRRPERSLATLPYVARRVIGDPRPTGAAARTASDGRSGAPRACRAWPPRT